MVSRELQAQAGLLQAQPGDLGLADRLVLVAYRLDPSAKIDLWFFFANRKSSYEVPSYVQITDFEGHFLGFS